MNIYRVKERLHAIAAHITSMIVDESEEYELVPQWKRDVEALETAIEILNRVTQD